VHAHATVTAVGPGNVRINRVTQWRVRYRYQDQLGREHEGRSPHLAPEEGEIWTQGDTANIKFDPQRPGKSVWLGKEA
jgi:hypothetical protein